MRASMEYRTLSSYRCVTYAPSAAAGRHARTSRAEIRHPSGGTVRNPAAPLVAPLLIAACAGIAAPSIAATASPPKGPAAPNAVSNMDISHPMDVNALHMDRSEEHTSELQSRFGISYAVFC